MTQSISRARGVRRLRERIDAPAAFEDLFSADPDLPRFRRFRSAERFLSLALLNSINGELLRRLPRLGLPEWWLASGCLFQTVWNVISGRNPAAGISDYDVIFYDPDTSWAAEDRWIRAAAELFADLKVDVQLRNQARVHLWYPDKFGLEYPPLKTARHAVRRYPCRASAVAVTVNDAGELLVYAPFGFTRALTMLIDANDRLPIEEVYAAKAARWRTEWPSLRICPWPRDGGQPETE